MANLTITVDAETLKRARVRAIERGESVNRYLADQLRAYAEEGDDYLTRQRASADRIAEIARRVGRGSGDGQALTREEIYAERLDRHATT